MNSVNEKVVAPVAEVIARRAQRRRRLRRLAILLACFGGFALVAHGGSRAVIANTTSSVDPGLYLWRPGWTGGEVQVGGLVSLTMPEAARPYFAERAGRPVEDAADWFLVKPVAAGEGDHVDTTGNRVLVNGRDLGPIYDRDDAGRNLPRVKVNRTLRQGEWLLVSRRCPGSLDGRYFGPVTTERLEAVRVPLVRWGDGSDGSWTWGGRYEDRPWVDGQAAECPATKVQ